MTRDRPQTTVPFLEVISLLDAVRNRLLLIDRVRRQNFVTWLQGVCELLWIKIILTELKLAPSGSMRLYCDNKVAINIAHNSVQHNRTKHVEIDKHFIK